MHPSIFIPKPNKDHKAAKGWRSINLINCIGKLAEKVVAAELQEAGLFHKGQYGGIKGRSVLEVDKRGLRQPDYLHLIKNSYTTQYKTKIANPLEESYIVLIYSAKPHLPPLRRKLCMRTV